VGARRAGRLAALAARLVVPPWTRTPAFSSAAAGDGEIGRRRSSALPGSSAWIQRAAAPSAPPRASPSSAPWMRRLLLQLSLAPLQPAAAQDWGGGAGLRLGCACWRRHGCGGTRARERRAGEARRRAGEPQTVRRRGMEGGGEESRGEGGGRRVCVWWWELVG
jgi:hypothetical protein